MSDASDSPTPGMLKRRHITGYKWPTEAIDEMFKSYNTRPNMSKILKFQKHTNSLNTCVQWAVNSIHNDADQSDRELGHGTGAY